MTIQQIEYVLAVIEHGSFSRAAEACFVTQPTLSAQITKLEQELGIFLLDRINRPVGPAPGAEEILDRARAGILSIKSIPALAEEHSNSLSGELRVGIIPTLSQYLLPLFLESFLKEFPDLHLKISELKSEDILRGIKEFHFDCGIIALPAKAEGLLETDLFFEDFLVYLPPGDRASGRIDINDLKRDELLLLTEGHCFRDQVIDFCGNSGSGNKARIEFETGSLESLKKLVDQGVGHTLLPELSILDMPGAFRERVHPIGPVTPSRKIGLVSNPAYIRPGLLKLFENAIKASLPVDIREKKNETFLPWRK